MSATLCYEPMNGRTPLSSSSPSRHKEQLESLFERDLPLTLSTGSLPELRAARVACDEHSKMFWLELIQAVEKYHTITVHAEY